MNPIHEDRYLGTKTRVFDTHVTFSLMGHTQTIGLNQIANVTVPALSKNIIIETTGGQKISIPAKRKRDLADAIMGAMYAGAR